MTEIITKECDLHPQALHALELILAIQFGALFENKAPSLPNVIKLSASTVEKYTSQGNTLTSEQKLIVAKKLVPIAIDLYQKNGKITTERAKELKEKIIEDVNIVTDIISVIIDTANDPTDLVGKTKQEVQAAILQAGKKTSKRSSCW
jgi:hypothetical protein